jgi:hypothetical protein
MKTINTLLAALFAVSLLSACGRSTTVYSDGAVDAVVGTDGRSLLPNGFYDQSVNHAIVEISEDPSQPQLRFRLLGGTSAAGSFNDSSATGNRALLGISKYDHSALAAFSLGVTATSETSSDLSVSLLVDLNCDGASAVRNLIADSIATRSTGSVTSLISINTAIWSVSGAPLTDSSSNILVHSNSGSARSDLSQLLASYPNACLRNDRSDAPDAPSNLPIGSVLLSIGGVTSTSVETLNVSDLTINGDDVQTWGQR